MKVHIKVSKTASPENYWPKFVFDLKKTQKNSFSFRIYIARFGNSIFAKKYILVYVLVAVREFGGDGAENLNISKLRHQHKTSDKNWVYSIFQINSR